MIDIYKKCTVCPFECKVDRTSGKTGRCHSSDIMRVARIAPHYWEEPCLSGQCLEEPVMGSGTVFFVGCNLGCVFCQNGKISKKGSDLGTEYSPDSLAREFLKLQKCGVHNINLVTATHFAPSVAESLRIAKEYGLTVPVVYNCGGYESVSTLKSLEGLIDIYMPDFKFFSEHLSEQYASVKDYKDVCENAIGEMQRQTGAPVFDEKGFMLSGTLVRHLVLPGSDMDSKKIISYLHRRFGSDGIALSLMSQYTPQDGVEFEELREKLSFSAYLRVVRHAQKLGFDILYTQNGESADESFIPDFK